MVSAAALQTGHLALGPEHCGGGEHSGRGQHNGGGVVVESTPMTAVETTAVMESTAVVGSTAVARSTAVDLASQQYLHRSALHGTGFASAPPLHRCLAATATRPLRTRTGRLLCAPSVPPLRSQKEPALTSARVPWGYCGGGKETSDTNGRDIATDPVNTAVPDLQQ